MAGKISDLTAATSVVGTDEFEILTGGVNKRATATKVADFVEGRASLAELIRDTIAAAAVAGSNMTITPNDGADTITFASTGGGTAGHPGYIAGNWYQPIQGSVVAGGAPGTGSIRLIPFMLRQPITIQALAVRIATLAAAGNCQAAIYAHNATTGRPTGNAVASTASMSTGTAAVVSASVTSTALTAGVVYWMAVNQDNATVVYQSLATAFAQQTFLIGTATLANVAGSNSGGNLGLSVAQTFGTWPDLTSATFVEVAVTSAVNSALVYMQAA